MRPSPRDRLLRLLFLLALALSIAGLILSSAGDHRVDDDDELAAPTAAGRPERRP